jgi:hypothetical protein
VVDFFLFNGQRGATGDTPPARALSAELRDALLRRKRQLPGLMILVLNDPINDVYGSIPSSDMAALRGAGIEVVDIDLDALRDSNFIYSALWRITTKWWSGDGKGDAWLPNPLDAGPGEVSFGAWARLLNFKANHRKVLIADDGHGGITGIVTSANPHDASSRHSNVALKLHGAALQPLLDSELALARESGWNSAWEPPPLTPAAPLANPVDAAHVQVLTEGEIGAAILRNFALSRAGDNIDIAMFYLSDRNVIEALIAASKRGVAVRVILDPNKDAFGRTKNGIPNRSVATELAAASDGAIKVRWIRTHGEQFHSKLVAMRTAEEFWFTLDPPTSRAVTSRTTTSRRTWPQRAAGSQLAASVGTWYEMLWSNLGRRTWSTPPSSAPTPIRPEHLLALSPHGGDRAVHFLGVPERAARLPVRGTWRSISASAVRSRLRIPRSPRRAGLRPRARTLGGETREQGTIAMSAEGAVEGHVNGRRFAAGGVVGLEAPQFASAGCRPAHTARNRRTRRRTGRCHATGRPARSRRGRVPAQPTAMRRRNRSADRCAQSDFFGGEARAGFRTLHQQAAAAVAAGADAVRAGSLSM